MNSRCYREGCPRQTGGQGHEHVEVHYERGLPDGTLVPTYSVWVLTDDHPTASYGQPVLVVETTMRHGDPLSGGVYGYGDLPGDAVIVGDRSAGAELRGLVGWGARMAN